MEKPNKKPRMTKSLFGNYAQVALIEGLFSVSE
jgi:hypothetical protein